MRILSFSEVEELQEHLKARSDIWVFHNDVWIRTTGPDEYALGLQFKNGLPGGMYSLTHKEHEWSRDETTQYVDWLLEKYTAYAERQKVVNILSSVVKSSADIHALSRDLCELKGGEFTRKHE